MSIPPGEPKTALLLPTDTAVSSGLVEGFCEAATACDATHADGLIAAMTIAEFLLLNAPEPAAAQELFLALVAGTLARIGSPAAPHGLH